MLHKVEKITGTVITNGTEFKTGTQINDTENWKFMPAQPDIISLEIYESAKLQYWEICQSIQPGDIDSMKAVWADGLCAGLIEYELLNNIEA